MSKFTVGEKLNAIKRYLNGIESQRTIADSIGVNKAVLQNWIKQYQSHGEKAFEKSYTSYSSQYKLDVLNYMDNNGTSPNETAVIFNISSPGLIRKWRIQFESQGIDALESKKKGRPAVKKETKKSTPVEGSVEALQAELERLRMENAYLKKLNALVQNKEKSPNKTKRK
jgi:transposase